MAIHALPPTTVRTLGASQVLTDSASLVKELLDNALDAKATAVSVEISANTLDVIQVRDNGHGIAPEDRSMVARRYCTSKITGEEDLLCIGGSSLGFRGEAMSSAAEMSGSMTVSTRTEGEQVAATLKIGHNGEVVGQERASLPVGTTVKIIDFVKAHPVRKQQALKNAEKTLKKVKLTLQAYAFARTSVRLSLKILKAKNDKGNFMYAPKAGGNAEDAAFKLVGAACAHQCTWSVVEEGGFTLQAFLPRPDADPGKISNIGAFVSVDGRPMAATRGTLKAVGKIYRETLKRTSDAFDGVKEPFLYLDIQCPSASYDTNVEPAKDDVLFTDAEQLLYVARTLFNSVYPPIRRPSKGNVSDQAAARKSMPSRALEDEDGFFTSLEPASTLKRPGTLDPNNFDSSMRTARGIDYDADHPKAKRQRPFRPNMYGCDEEDLELLDQRPATGQTEADFTELREAANDPTVSNPWVMAKMNTSTGSLVTEQAEDSALPTQPMDPEPPESWRFRDRKLRHHLQAPGLPTPRPSSPSPPHEYFDPSAQVSDARLARDGRLIGMSDLPPPELYMGPPSSVSGYDPPLSPIIRLQQLPAHGLKQHINEPFGTPLYAIPSTSQQARRSPAKRQARLDRPFVSPVPVDAPRERLWFDHLQEPVHGQQQSRRIGKRNNALAISSGLVVQGELGDLVDDPCPLTPPRRNRDIRDFVSSAGREPPESLAATIERRNFPGPTVRARARSVDSTAPTHWADENLDSGVRPRGNLGFMPASELPITVSQVEPLEEVLKPAKLRRITESRALGEISGNGSSRNDDDFRPATSTRATSRRRRTSIGCIHRTKSSRLPLESVPRGQAMHSTVLNFSTSAAQISHSAGKIDEEWSLLGWNEPALGGYDVFAHEIGFRDVKALAEVLRELLINGVSDEEMVQDLGSLVGNGLAEHRAATAGDGNVPDV